MEPKNLIPGIIIGIILGGVLGYVIAPRPDIAGYEAQINNLQSQISSLQIGINDLTSQLNDAISLEEYNSALDQIFELQNDLSNLEFELERQNDTITHYESQLTELEEVIVEKENLINEKDDLITELGDYVETLENTFNYTPRALNLIKKWIGSAQIYTAIFNIPSDQVKITWILDVNQGGTFSIELYNDHNVLVDSWGSLEGVEQGFTWVHDLTPGFHYFRFNAYRCTYDVRLFALAS